MSKEQLAQLYPTVIPIIVVKYLYPSGATLYTFLTAWAWMNIGEPPFTLIMTHGLQQLENGNMGAAEDMIALL